MSVRKPIRKYNFTVEGKTEQWYLQRLQDLINRSEESTLRVSISCPVNRNPEKYAKGLTVTSKIEIYHLFDYEGADEDRKGNFTNSMDYMKRAKNLKKQIQYKPAYSNLSFDLWIILHKMNCTARLTHSDQYLSRINRAFEERFEGMREYKRETNFKRCLGKIDLVDIKTAVQRAEKIMQRNEENGYVLKFYNNYKYYEENPSLSVWEPIKKILQDCQLM